MNPFNAHPHEQGVTYLAHLGFAIGIALRLLQSAVAFFMHALFPFIGIDRSLDLTATSRFLQEQNAWIEGKKTEVEPMAPAMERQWG